MRKSPRGRAAIALLAGAAAPYPMRRPDAPPFVRPFGRSLQMSPQTAVVTDLTRTVALDAFDSQIRTLVAAADSAGAVSVLHIVAEPVSGPPLHLHAREDELFYVEAGDVGFYCDGRRWRGGPGTQAFLPRGVPHTWYNHGRTPARLLVTCVPGGFEGYFAAVLAATAGRADVASGLAEAGAAFGIELVGPNPLAEPLEAPA
jgi:quercetin dioxygenase-like cupin family protein